MEKEKRKKEKESLLIRQKLLRMNNNIYKNNINNNNIKYNNNNICNINNNYNYNYNQKKINYTNNDSKKNEEINQILEDMCIYGNIVKKEIEEETKLNPNKFIPKSQALNSEEIDEELFALGLLSQNLENLGIKTVIEKDGYANSKNDDENITKFTIHY